MSQGFSRKFADANKSSRYQSQPKEVAEIGAIQQSLVKHFGNIKDPRVERTKKHLLIDILVIANKSNNCGSALCGKTLRTTVLASKLG